MLALVYRKACIWQADLLECKPKWYRHLDRNNGTLCLVSYPEERPEWSLAVCAAVDRRIGGGEGAYLFLSGRSIEVTSMTWRSP